MTLACAPTVADPNPSPSATTPTSSPITTPSLGTTATPSTTAAPSATAAAPAVTLKAQRTAVPVNFRYDETWPGRIVMFDLDARAAFEVATYEARATDAGYPGASLSASRDGRTLLALVHVAPSNAVLYVLTPETGDARVLASGSVTAAVISPDGGQLALTLRDADPARNGLWLANTGTGRMVRLASDDPGWAGGPPLPLAFSPDASRLAFTVPVFDGGSRGAVVSLPSPEIDARKLREDHPSVAGLTVLDLANGAEFRSADELFVWSSSNAFGGKSLAYTYDLRTDRSTTIALPSVRIADARARPGTQQFVTLEQPECCGINPPRTAWLRERDGTGRVVGTPNPFFGDVWWSPDGTKLYATVGGDDSVGGVTELLTNTQVMAFCRRGGAQPACT